MSKAEGGVAGGPGVGPSGPSGVVGLDWLELPVRSVKRSLAFYLTLGFAWRGGTQRRPRVGLGGLGVMLRQRRLSGEHGKSGLVFQVAVDDLGRKREELRERGVEVGRIRPQVRGDSGFEVEDPDGHVVRFCGPRRRANDPTLD